MIAWSATDLRDRLRRREVTARAVALAFLARVDAREAEVHAWAFLDRDTILAQADALDRKAASGAAPGPLHGLPIGVKDIILTADQPTRYNSPLYDDFDARLDAACITVLRQAGAIVFGKTDTVEFGATGRKAATHNPHAPGHTPGGSSSGSAAAVADRHVPLALGTQTGGSMIRPASYCGTWALKPTWGLVGNEGVRPYAPSLDTVGWFANTAADLRLLYDVFDPDPGDADVPFKLRGAAIALCRTPGWHRAEPATMAAFERARACLIDAGTRVVDLDNVPHVTLAEMQMRIMRSEGRASLLAEYRRCPEALEPTLRDQVLNTDRTTRRQLVDAYDRAAECRRTFDAVAASYDAVLAPSSVGSAPAGLAATGDLIFNGLWTLLHVPCVNIPGWQDDRGLPVGLTVTGARFADRQVMAVAEAIGAQVRAASRSPQVG